MNYQLLTQTLIESFNALADEVQSLADRKTILEHKLRYAHEQFQFLADKHAPAATEISETLANLQIPPELHRSSLIAATRVPLPARTKSSSDSCHKIALVIRDGRRVAQQLASLVEASKTSLSSRDAFSRASQSPSSMPTELEQDFTVEGTKGQLGCPFSRTTTGTGGVADSSGANDSGGNLLDSVAAADKPSEPTYHDPTDPICAAMYEETDQRPDTCADASATKCPIRFMDQHSPEEIAHYVETHKHEIPRSHEVCVSRYQRNEEQIRKLDAKYGNLVSMIQGLSQLHQPMLPSESADEAQRRQFEVDKASNERVESWAQEVSASGLALDAGDGTQMAVTGSDVDAERVGRFDRPLKEVRVGESPSRPWGISVPVYQPYSQDKNGAPLSPPPAPVVTLDTSAAAAKPSTRNCPFDHAKLMSQPPESFAKGEKQPSVQDGVPSSAPFAQPTYAGPPSIPQPQPQPRQDGPLHAEPPRPQPTFINPSAAPLPQTQTANKPGWPVAQQGVPQMVFTGPVFIGYPIDQAIQLMNHWQGGWR